MEVDVTLKGQDRRYAVELLLKEIEKKRERLTNGSRWYHCNEDEDGGVRRILDDAQLPKPVQKLLTKLRELDDQKRALKRQLGGVHNQLVVALNGQGELGTTEARGDRPSRYVVRETHMAQRERLDGNAKARREQVKKLDALKDRLILALPTDEPLDTFVTELRALGKR